MVAMAATSYPNAPRSWMLIYHCLTRPRTTCAARSKSFVEDIRLLRRTARAIFSALLEMRQRGTNAGSSNSASGSGDCHTAKGLSEESFGWRDMDVRTPGSRPLRGSRRDRILAKLNGEVGKSSDDAYGSHRFGDCAKCFPVHSCIRRLTRI